jgi:DNA-binding NtrC family response regulator
MNPLDVLIVDDERDLAESLAEVLELDGHRVTLADSGQSGVAAARAGRFDLVLIDLKLPDTSGVQLVQDVRRTQPKAKSVVMTGYRVERLLEEAVEKGSVEVLKGPYEAEDLIAAVACAAPAGIVLLVDPGAAPGAVEESLSLHDLAAVTLRTAEEAAAMDPARPVDVCVLDLGTTILGALGVCLDMQARGVSKRTVILTRCPGLELAAPAEDPECLRALSVTGCLFKPFEPQDLLDMIRDIEIADGP